MNGRAIAIVFSCWLILTCFTGTCVYGLATVRDTRVHYQTLFVDPLNNLWLGSSKGLMLWKNSSSIRVNLPAILDITAIWGNGKQLVLGTRDGRVYLYNLADNRLQLYGNLHAEISSIQLHEATLCIATKGKGYVVLSLIGLQVYRFGNGLNDDFIYKLQGDTHHQLWSSSDMGMNVLDTNGIIHSLPFNRFIPDRLVTSFALEKNRIFCGTQRGDLCIIAVGDTTVHTWNKEIWYGATINDILLLDHTVAIATDSGAFLLDTQGRCIEELIHKQQVTQLKTDQEGMLWGTGPNLLFSSHGETCRLLLQLAGERLHHVHALLCDQRGGIYFTPDQGLYYYSFITEKIRSIPIPAHSPDIDITALHLDPKGQLWVGTSGGGLFHADTTDFRYSPVVIDTSLESSAILSIQSDADRLWVSSLNGVWYHDFRESVLHFHSLENDYHQRKYYVYQVLRDANGILWLATDGQGILRIEHQQISPFPANHKLDHKSFYSLVEDARQHLWFNAYLDGLYTVQGDSLFHLSENNGLSSNDVLGMIRYNANNLLAVTRAGLDLIDIHNRQISTCLLDPLRPDMHPEINAVTSDHQGHVYIGTDKGILQFYLPSYQVQFSPKASIDEISVMGKNCSRLEKSFDPDSNYFRFGIAGIYHAEQNLYYRYRLQGLSEQWNQTVDHEVVFPRLSPGHYNFILQVAANPSFYGATSDEYAFEIRYPFWKQIWFICLELAFIAVMLYLIIRFRENRINREQQFERDKVIAEFTALKTQVNPHFLFNSFNTLIQIIDEDPEQAIEYTQMLSEYYRSLLSYHHADLVSFDEEMILLDKYIYLQKMRFGDSLHLQKHYSKNLTHGIEIPPFTFQLLAENAIKHNVVSSDKPLYLEIKINPLEILVSNNLNPKTRQEAGEQIGLANIRNRYKLFSKKEVEVIRTADRFIVVLPIIRTNDYII